MMTWKVTATFVAIAMFSGCGGDTGKSGNNAANGQTNGQTNAPENNDTVTRLPVEELCTSAAVTSQCSGDCTILADVVVSCDDNAFTDPIVETLIAEGRATVVTFWVARLRVLRHNRLT